MDKNKIKSYAVWARRAMIQGVSDRAHRIGIEEGHIHKAEAVQGGFRIEGKDEIFNFPLSDRNKLISLINEKGFEQVMEEVAYTWFNRFMGLRYMEVNEYLPMGIRILSSELDGRTEPDVFSHINEVIEELDLKVDEIYELLDTAQQEDKEKVYRKILIAQCNKMGEIIPQMFEKIKDYTELLMPDNLLEKGSVVDKMVTDISEEDWREEVEIIGWMYQYYISEKKDAVFSGLESGKKINKEDIPAATQLFTPKWIVQCMLENTLLDITHSPDNLKDTFSYYATKKPSYTENIHFELIEDFKLIDPSMGSGHILIYAFDILYKIYEVKGYSIRDIPLLILKHNIYGLDIDDRAAQLTSFALIMKARSYNRRFFSVLEQDPYILNVLSIKESNILRNSQLIKYFSNGNEKLENDFIYIIDSFYDSKEYGSLIELNKIDYEALEDRLEELNNDNNLMFLDYKYSILENLPSLIHQFKILTNSYQLVCTNPPYSKRTNLNMKTNQFLVNNFEVAKQDLYTAFILRSLKLLVPNGKLAMITQSSFMFKFQFKSIRKYLVENFKFIDVLKLGPGAFEEIKGEVVQSVVFIGEKIRDTKYQFNYMDLSKVVGAKNKELEYLNRLKECTIDKKEIDTQLVDEECLFIKSHLSNLPKIQVQAKIGSQPGSKLIKYWWEVKDMSMWKRYNKGGEFRKWYGNNLWVVKYGIDGEIISRSGGQLSNKDYYFKPHISWTRVSSKLNMRFYDQGMLFDNTSPGIFNDLYYLLGYYNSSVCEALRTDLFGGNKIEAGQINALAPIIPTLEIRNTIEKIVKENIEICKQHWNSSEISFDFTIHPLISENYGLLEDNFLSLQQHNLNQRAILVTNQEHLNTIFSKLYDLEDEISVDVRENEAKITQLTEQTEIKSLISFIIGCIVNRYSHSNKNIPDFNEDIILITDEEYFENDLVFKVIEFIKNIYGEIYLEDNLNYIAQSLGQKNTETPRQTIRRYLLRGFYKDHCKLYQKCPIYWQFDSGKENGFRALMYIHEYTESTIARVRTDFLHVLQKKYEHEIQRVQTLLETTVLLSKDKTSYTKHIDKLKKQLLECQEYDQVVAHLANERISIDLDDGVKVNYAKFQDVKVINRSGKEVKMNLFTKI